MEYKDYYRALGVEKSASADDIKKAYRKLIRKYHPDLSKEANADKRTKELNEAYGVLGDADKRAAYDELGKQPRGGQPFRPQPGRGAGPAAQGGANSDMFADLFAHLGGRRRGPVQARGEDSHASIVITLADAYHGATRAISLPERTLNVTIPKGVTGGQQLRLGGQGQPGRGGGAAGDLYLEIQFEADPRYRVEGRDVFITLPVAPWEAALGAQIDLPTPSGKVSVTVPEKSQTGRKLRLKGRGIPGAVQAGAVQTGAVPGDLYLLLEVALPPADTPQARALYETMAREMAFNPRQKMGA